MFEDLYFYIVLKISSLLKKIYNCLKLRTFLVVLVIFNIFTIYYFFFANLMFCTFSVIFNYVLKNIFNPFCLISFFFFTLGDIKVETVDFNRKSYCLYWFLTKLWYVCTGTWVIITSNACINYIQFTLCPLILISTF